MNVWAYRFGGFTSKPGQTAGWSHVIWFDTVQTLLAQLEKRRVPKGKVRKLAILAHGDAGGLVQLEDKRPLDAVSSALFAAEFKSLRSYLSDYARLIFCSCITASGVSGSWLLKTLSGVHFPKIHVIGFEKYGVIQKNFANVPGQVWCSRNQLFVVDCNPPAQRKPVTGTGVASKPTQILNEYSIYSKWSYGGRIIKIPHSEVRRTILLAAPKVIYGRKAVMRALKNTQERSQIKYIAMQQLQSLNDFFNTVQRQPYDFKYGAGPGKLRLLEASELTKLAGVRHHGGVIAVYEPKVAYRFKCASPRCPSHKESWHICEGFVKSFPNGPLT